jgi:hypothetical protein
MHSQYCTTYYKFVGATMTHLWVVRFERRQPEHSLATYGNKHWAFSESVLIQIWA